MSSLVRDICHICLSYFKPFPCSFSPVGLNKAWGSTLHLTKALVGAFSVIVKSPLIFVLSSNAHSPRTLHICPGHGASGSVPGQGGRGDNCLALCTWIFMFDTGGHKPALTRGHTLTHSISHLIPVSKPCLSPVSRQPHTDRHLSYVWRCWEWWI